MDEIVAEIPSVTVFWEDLEIFNGRTLYRQQNNIMASFWELEVDPWMKEHIKGHWNPHEAGVWFADRRDALLFRIYWTDKFPEVWGK